MHQPAVIADEEGVRLGHRQVDHRLHVGYPRHGSDEAVAAVSAADSLAGALERFVAVELLYCVHACVCGVLALESEPVDPRL